MNKNLKKVISAVAAIAMTASSFVALAANYPDVDASASYKQAVDELSALNVINGYEDGTFQPDKLVTRAEFSKMVITALGSSELAQAEAAMNRDTAFTDVTGSHWAAGYVTAAVASSIINGFEDNTFRPDENVTYAQAMKMLVCAAGYEQWSVDKGGWPDGYMYWGNQLKVGNGVKDVTDNTEITRAQVAQMIDNTLNVPVCVDTHTYSYDQYGNRYPTLKQKDGTGADFESLLTKNHDTYKVKGIVAATNRSDADAVKVDEVQFTITNAKKWLDFAYAITKDTKKTIPAKVGDTDVEAYLQQYVEVLVREDDDDEYTILSVAPAGQTEEVTLNADDYDKTKSTADRIYFYADSRQSSYKINASTVVYVNGVAMSGTALDAINTYVDGNSASEVTLIDVPEDGSTDGTYDLIYVNAYDTVIVDTVAKADTDKPIINFMSTASAVAGQNLPIRLEIDTTDKTLSVSIIKDGKEIEISDLNERDVLSIKRDVTKDFKTSSFYEIYVSDETEEGRVSQYDPEEDEYIINGTTYSVVDGLVTGLNNDNTATYTIYLDAFGRIADYEEVGTAKKIAILNAVYEVRGSDVQVSLIEKDGTPKEYILRNATIGDATYQSAYDKVYEADGTKKPIQDRVVEYSLNANNELTIKKSLTSADAEHANGEFRAVSDKLDGYKVSTDVTSILNVADPKDVQAMAYSALVDEKEYEAYMFDRSSDAVYRFVLVVNGSGNYSPDTQMAIYKKLVNTQNDNDEAVTAYMLMVNGEEKQVYVEDAVADNTTLSVGDAIVYETNNAGEISKIDKITNINFSAGYKEVRDAFMSGENAIALTQATLDDLSSEDDKVSFAFGAVLDKSSSSITLAELEEDGITSKTIGKDYSYDTDVKVYVIDYNEKMKDAVMEGLVSSPAKLNINKAAYTDSTQKSFKWSYDGVDLEPNFALVRMVDKYVQEVYVMVPAY